MAVQAVMSSVWLPKGIDDAGEPQIQTSQLSDCGMVNNTLPCQGSVYHPQTLSIVFDC